MAVKAMIHDISPSIREGHKVWPGDTPPSREVLCDMKRGDTNGQGLNQFGAGWYVVSPAGKKVEHRG